jgi:2,4-dienoyl-CoA reductase-like NADH-dependent reductase (Old Yellow Enzyme family)
LEVVEAVAKAIGAEKTAVRFSPWAGLHGAHDDTPLETWSHLTRALETNHPNLAYLHFVEPRSSHLADAPVAPVEGETVLTLDPFRAIWSGPFISAGGYTYDPQTAYDRAETSPNNLVAVGRAFIANPDLVERYRNHWKLTPYNRDTFYSPGPVGYVDCPYYNAADSK